MTKVAVVYWSGSGNTEAMAKAIAEGVTNAGAQAELLNVSDTTVADLTDFDRYAFGCPAMGVEELEESEFEPFFAEMEGILSGKAVALFGSYGWGGGEWMRNWEERTRFVGAELFEEGLTVSDSPRDADLALCRAFGERFAK